MSAFQAAKLPPGSSLEAGPTRDAGEPSASVDWSVLVDQVKRGQDVGMEQLYRLFSRGIRFYLCRQLGAQELDDKVHDTFLIVVHAIQRGDLREPERLMGFVRTIVRRQVAAYIDEAVHSRREQAELDTGHAIVDLKENPEQIAMAREKAGLMKSVLASLSERDREILERFYLNEQPQDLICEQMHLSETQFRLLKSRAKARFGEIGKKKLLNSGLFTVFLRTQPG
ncbi:MAG: sigma-70 family RNA polymerase sigma factor [Bryobacteraceae bacterium]